MANSSITGLTELTTPADGDFIPIVDVSEAIDANKNKKITRRNLAGWTFLTTPLTSTSWDGDARSTTAKTLIDLSAVFGVPAGVKAVLVEMSVRDSGAATSECRLILSPNNTSLSGMHLVAPKDNDFWITANSIIPCDANGDIYYQVVASGTGTFDAYMQIWGYWL